MEPIDYLRALRARWYVIVVAGLAGVIATWLTTPDRPAPIQTSGIEQYTATHTLIQEEVGSDGRSVDLNRAALLTRTGEVPRRVVQKLGLDVPPAVLATSVDVQTEAEVRALRITVTHQDGPTAARLADTFAAETVAYLDERERARQQRLIDVATARADALQRQSIELQAQIPTLREDRRALAQAQYEALVRQFGVAYEQLQAVASQDPTLSGLVTLEEATPLGVAQGGIRAPATRGGRIMLLVPVALGLGVAVVLLLHRVDTRLRTKEDAEAAFALPVVAEVPLLSWHEQRRLSLPRPGADPPPHFAEAFRTLRSSVRFMAPRALTPDPAVPGVAGIPAPAATATGAEVLLVTSPGVAEGKTTVVCNLAASFARAGHSVLVLDFDLANPDTAARLGARGGAVRVSPGEPNVRAADLARPTAVRGVSVVADWRRPRRFGAGLGRRGDRRHAGAPGGERRRRPRLHCRRRRGGVPGRRHLHVRRASGRRDARTVPCHRPRRGARGCRLGAAATALPGAPAHGAPRRRRVAAPARPA
jgi:capsular polysaccharide biosynthesis protein